MTHIGTPAREFLLLFDTGSADTWVVGPSCTNTTTCAADNVYDPNASTTYASTPYDFIINYAIGSSNGTYAVDRVAVDDAVLPQQMFAVVNDTEHFFTTQDPNSQYTIDGILGASYPWSTSLQAYYNVSYLPIPFALYAAHLIPEPVFSVHMGQAFQQHNNTDTATTGEDVDLWTGSVTFGAVNTSIIDPQAIRYTNISVWRQYATNETGYMFWDGRANQITMENNNNTTTILSSNMSHAPSFIIDTGSNYFSMPEKDAQELIINHLAPEAHIRKEQGGYFVDCNNPRLSDNTTLSIHFYDSSDHTGATTFPLTFPISDLVFQVDQEQCILAISPGNQYVVGNFILYRFLSIFDFGNHRVGFAPLKDSP
ncbi:achain rmp-pepstatin a complex [Lichtheimia corymbifera JMRC:FSU:9682]|uniref:Achain rmp-pepstatin a complex n=1 Tax=Lichtheimia corymbifera JMRC:FSU:9682 TaxID=1263082 RepID=A0A068S2K3_9FUNG|nr:achain rmp-pepstatin a complex [Lichtheimia corymbifera JMRC:FSU:9682]